MNLVFDFPALRNDGPEILIYVQEQGNGQVTS